MGEYTGGARPGNMRGDVYPLGDTDYATPPGEVLRELLEERGLSEQELARRAGLGREQVSGLLQGAVPLSAEVARRLEHVTGVSAQTWSQKEADYRSDLERLRSR